MDNFSSSVLFDDMHTNTKYCGTVRLLDRIKKYEFGQTVKLK